MYRLVYKSMSTGMIDKEAFRDILYSSVQMNKSHGVNGALIATRNGFLQFLEGEKDVVEQTFTRIELDNRHENVSVIASGEIKKAKFTEWRMRGFGLFGLNLDLEKELVKKYGEDAGTVLLPDSEELAFQLVDEVEMLNL